jgi:hypothetical protein
MGWFGEQQPAWSKASEARILAAFQQGVKSIMGNTNQSAANLAAEEQKVEGLVTALGTAQATTFADLKAEVTAALASAGSSVPQAQVDAVTAKMAAFEATITGLTTAAQTADPGTGTTGA